MAREAERLLAGAGWVPEPLRTPDAQSVVVDSESGAETLPAFLADGEDDKADDATASDPEEPHAVAAE
jgi:ParB family chromosome partitioning protein